MSACECVALVVRLPGGLLNAEFVVRKQCIEQRLCEHGTDLRCIRVCVRLARDSWGVDPNERLCGTSC